MGIHTGYNILLRMFSTQKLWRHANEQESVVHEQQKRAGPPKIAFESWKAAVVNVKG